MLTIIFLNTNTGGAINGNKDMRGHTIKYLGLDMTPSAVARVAELGKKISKVEDTMTGDLDMGNHKLTNVQFDNNSTSVTHNQELSLKFE